MRALFLILFVQIVITMPCTDHSKEEDLLKEARASEVSGDIRRAERCLKLCTKLYPKSSVCWFQRGIRAQREDKHATSTSLFKNAANLKPSSFEAWHMLGGSLLLQGSQHAAKAHEHLLKGEKLNPSFAALISDLALATYYLGRVDDALKLWKRCISLEPKNEASHLYNMIGVYQERGRLRTARKLLRRMLALAPGSAEAHESLAVVQARNPLLQPMTVPALSESFPLFLSR